MIISQIIWWIWNQMFQYAFGKYLAQKTNSELILDINGLWRPTFAWYKKRNFALDHLNTPNLKYIYTPFHNSKSTYRNIFDYGRFFLHTKFDLVYQYIYWYKIIKQNWFEYKDIYSRDADLSHLWIKSVKSENYSNIDNKYIIGFWQSEKFWEAIANEVKEDFKLWYTIPDFAKELLNNIQNSNSIAINVRRTDFVQIGKIANMHDVCTTKYYQDSIDYIYSDLGFDSKFFVFSDDMQRCRDNLKFPTEVVFVDPNIYKWFEYELYMHILWQCKHYIIPNSSFARWAVYLWRNSDKKVIIPDRRFNNDLNTSDLIPDRRNATKIKTK